MNQHDNDDSLKLNEEPEVDEAESMQEEEDLLGEAELGEDVAKDGHWKASPEEAQVFKSVDRDSEDSAIHHYQQLRDKRDFKSKELLEIRRPTLLKWAQNFREVGRTQQAVSIRLHKVWEQCLLVREVNGGNFPDLLRKTMLSDLEIHAKKNGRERAWLKAFTSLPDVPQLESENALFLEYLSIISEINDLLGKLYAIREPTMKVWAKRYHYLASSEEEMLGELRLIWVKCVNDYEYEAKERIVSTKRGHHVHDGKGAKTRIKKTNFNTYKFTSFRNFIVNQLKRKYKCAKRVDNNGVPFEQTMMSLDHQYDDREGDGISLHDVVPGTVRHEGRSLAIDMIIDKITSHDKKMAKDMRYALEKLSYDPHVKTLEAACRLRSGSLGVVRADRDIINAGEASKDSSGKVLLTRLIQAAGLYDCHFSVVSIDKVLANSVEFEVKVRDTQLLMRTKKAIKAAKLEKEFHSL